MLSDMISSREDFRAEMRGVRRAFYRRARNGGFSLASRNTGKVPDHGDHLFEERGLNRWFIIDFGPDTQFDAFLKKTGLDSEIDVLYLITPGGAKFYNDMCKLYKSWIKDSVSLEEMGRMLSEFDPKQ